MERSDAIVIMNVTADFIRHDREYHDNMLAADQFEDALQTLINAPTDPKARFDRYVCAAMMSGNYDAFQDDDTIADEALSLMLAADKRWEEYMKGGQDVPR